MEDSQSIQPCRIVRAMALRPGERKSNGEIKFYYVDYYHDPDLASAKGKGNLFSVLCFINVSTGLPHPLPESLRMSDQALPTLEHLAIQGLASNERLAISVVEDLPKVFFPPLFKEAFIKRRKKLVKHMVTTWPYPYLYIGPLLDDFDVDTFKAVLEGVDRLNCQKVRSR